MPIVRDVTIGDQMLVNTFPLTKRTRAVSERETTQVLIYYLFAGFHVETTHSLVPTAGIQTRGKFIQSANDGKLNEDTASCLD